MDGGVARALMPRSAHAHADERAECIRSLSSLPKREETGVIVIDEDVYAYDGTGMGANQVIVVTGTFDHALVVQALEKAGERMMLVDDDGHEHGGFDEVDAAGAYTPSYVSAPSATARGIEMYLDAQGVIEMPMRQTLLRVLEEELGRVVTDARVSDGSP